MAATPHDSSGTTVSFGGQLSSVTDITVNNTDPGGDDTLDISHLGLADGDSVLTQARPLVGSSNDTGSEIQVEGIGSSAPSVGTEATLTISGGFGNYSGCARCTASSVRGTVNDVVRYSATFRFGIAVADGEICGGS